MKTINTPPQRHVMIWALGLIITLLVLVWLFSGHLANAQSDDTRQPDIAEAQTGTSFTYQGQLILSGPPAEPANGTYRFSFGLFDSATGGAQIGSFSAKDILVTNGLFTTILNKDGEFGSSAFTGEARYLEIRVSTDGGSTSTTLTPRQLLSAAPYALSLRPGAVISGTMFNAGILNLSNNNAGGTGLSVNSTGVGISVPSAGTTGVSVESSGASAFYVDNAATNGLRVLSAVTGVNIASASSTGVQVDSAGVGVQVNEAGTGFYVSNATSNGLLIDSASTGVNVGTVTAEGVNIASAATGVNISNVTQDGLFVCATGTNTTCTSNDSLHNGVEIGNAAHYGLWVNNAGSDGVLIVNAGDDGMQIAAAGDDGLDITATDDGVRVRTVGGDGLEVELANIGVHVGNAVNGIQIDAVTGVGFRVGTADTGVYVAGPVTTWAGYFTGNVNVVGTLSKSAGAFQIDHPLDPENKYLYHSFVESPDMKNIYDGLVVLDENGMASIQMEDWFDALNQEFRYQLTPIGAAMPGLYIAQEMTANGFQIAGGEAGMKVSWQVTGIRHDPYAEANRIQVEVDKRAEERGTYLYPELYDQPTELGLAYQKNLALDEQ